MQSPCLWSVHWHTTINVNQPAVLRSLKAMRQQELMSAMQQMLLFLRWNYKDLNIAEIPEARFQSLLSSKESLAACDAAIFFYDSSDEQLWKRAEEMLVDV
ncbi:hypothetical protein FRX31_031843 [Thalictrum thalictroides]|uniref:Uncharacterized protein n=1 Tax=Thalictrum thalictroides TaxID=46969 RepID=A0A7J6V0U0_THATH|nr:hypothetical protein FRX31_031843 [Thalictrum thalictroides]